MYHAPRQRRGPRGERQLTKGCWRESRKVKSGMPTFPLFETENESSGKIPRTNASSLKSATRMFCVTFRLCSCVTATAVSVAPDDAAVLCGMPVNFPALTQHVITSPRVQQRR